MEFAFSKVTDFQFNSTMVVSQIINFNIFRRDSVEHQRIAASTASIVDGNNEEYEYYDNSIMPTSFSLLMLFFATYTRMI